jgi:hypothetical protein
MNIDSPSEFCQAAILIHHLQSMKSEEAVEALKATVSEQEQRMARFRARLIDLFGHEREMQIKLNGGCVEAAIEELRFLSYEYRSPRTKELEMVITLLGRCPACGVETMSRPFVDLAGLGKLLVKFEPIFEHGCPTRQKRVQG